MSHLYANRNFVVIPAQYEMVKNALKPSAIDTEILQEILWNIEANVGAGRYVCGPRARCIGIS